MFKKFIESLKEKFHREPKEPKEKKEKKPIQIPDFKVLIKNRIILSITAITLSALLVFGGSALMDKIQNSAAEIMQAKSDIPKGTLITSDMLETTRVGSLGLPLDIVYNHEQIVNTYSKVDIFKGDNIVISKTTHELPFEDPELYSIAIDKYAISISLNTLASSVSAKIRAGDVVSILSTPLKDNYNTENYVSFAPDELKYIEVISVTSDNAVDIKSKADISSEASTLPKSVTLLANREQAKVLVGLEQTSQIHLALATRNTEEKKTLLNIQEDYFKKDEPDKELVIND